MQLYGGDSEEAVDRRKWTPVRAVAKEQMSLPDTGRLMPAWRSEGDKPLLCWRADLSLQERPWCSNKRKIQ